MDKKTIVILIGMMIVDSYQRLKDPYGLGLWQLLSATIQVLTLLVALQPTSYSHSHSPILQQHSIASLRRASR